MRLSIIFISLVFVFDVMAQSFPGFPLLPFIDPIALCKKNPPKIIVERVINSRSYKVKNAADNTAVWVKTDEIISYSTTDAPRKNAFFEYKDSESGLPMRSEFKYEEKARFVYPCSGTYDIQDRANKYVQRISSVFLPMELGSASPLIGCPFQVKPPELNPNVDPDILEKWQEQKDVETITNHFYLYLKDMSDTGQRLYGLGIVNNAYISAQMLVKGLQDLTNYITSAQVCTPITINTLGCGEQAGEMLSRINKCDSVKLSWKKEICEYVPFNTTNPLYYRQIMDHQWAVMHRAKSTSPMLIVDPWRGMIIQVQGAMKGDFFLNSQGSENAPYSCDAF